jgi:hypothetical protein
MELTSMAAPAVVVVVRRRGLAMLRFNDARIDELVKQPYERDYALVLLFSTNDPKCEPCRYVRACLH